MTDRHPAGWLTRLRERGVLRVAASYAVIAWLALQIASVNPRIGRFLLPPCTQRKLAEKGPICPEGDRYCGVRVWKMEVADYKRLI